MKFSLFVYCTVGRREELEAGMAGKNPELYSRMLAELSESAQLADELGYFGFGHPEHHLQIEGMEASNDPCLMSMWLGQHSKNLRIIPCGFVSTTNNPLVTAEKIATLDCMLGGRLGVGMVRGYQARWLDNFRIQPQLKAVGPGMPRARSMKIIGNTSPNLSILLPLLCGKILFHITVNTGISPRWISIILTTTRCTLPMVRVCRRT